MRGDRPVETGQDEFATARLPSGDEDAIEAAPPPHEVLGIDPDASDDEVQQAYRERVQEVHPDQGGTHEQFTRVKRARDKMLGKRSTVVKGP